MGVYIKGMETPKSCYSCPLRKRNGIDIVCPVAQERFSVADVNILFYRLDSCPSVEIPEPHGRLIDADKLKETLDYYIREAGWNDEINKALSWVKDEFIDSEQSVIPASWEAK